MATILCAIITGGCSVIAVIITNISANNKFANSINMSQAIVEVKIEELTREVREHNNFAKRVPILEEQVKTLKKNIEKLEKGE